MQQAFTWTLCPDTQITWYKFFFETLKQHENAHANKGPAFEPGVCLYYFSAWFKQLKGKHLDATSPLHWNGVLESFKYSIYNWEHLDADKPLHLNGAPKAI